jgi:raffinose/stachyose/melibiose transport system substrate-binding protein
MRHRRTALAGVAVAAIAPLAVVAQVASARHAAATTTLVVWDAEAAGPSKTLNQLNAAFEKAHPNITIKRVNRGDFNAYQTQVKLAASSSSPPDVFEGNQGYGLDGQLVKAKLIQPLDKIAAKYGWSRRFSSTMLRPMRWTPDGKHWGSGPLWGVSPKAEIVGVFYNKALLAKLGLKRPTTFASFQSSLAAAKQKGITPILVGDLDQWPMRDVLAPLIGVYAPPKSVNDWIFGRPRVSFNQRGVVKALATLQQWAHAGYFEDGYLGVGQTDATGQFAQGKGLYFFTGPWENAGFTSGLGTKVGFFVLPGRPGHPPAAEGGPSLPFEISSKTKHLAEAAEYLDFIVSAKSARTWLRNGEVSSVKTVNPTKLVPQNSSLNDIIRAYQRQSSAERMFSYLDYATPTMTQTLLAGLQQFVGGSESATSFAQSVQKDWVHFHASG